MGILRNAKGKPIYPSSEMFVAEDTSFIAGDSPVTLDINATVGHNGNRGYITIDGAGDIAVEISHDGSTFETSFNLKSTETFDLTGLEVDSIRLTHSGTNSAYRVNCW